VPITTPTKDDCAANCAVTNGDPHVTTFDGRHVDFQAVGEFVALRSLDDSMQVQVRQRPFPDSSEVSVNTAVAMDVAGDRVGIYLRDGDMTVLVNGKPTQGDNATLPHTGTVTRTVVDGQPYLSVGWPDGSHARLTPIAAWGLALFLTVSAQRHGRLTGLLGNDDGNPDNDLAPRGGQPFTNHPSPHDLYQVFGDSWRVTQAESIFDYGAGETTATFTDRRFPTRTLHPADLPAHATAERICRQAGITSPQPLQDCTIDLALTGQAAFQYTAAVAQTFLASRTDAPASTPQSLTVTGAIAGRIDTAATDCTLYPSANRFTANLTARLAGEQLDIGIVVQNYHGAGTYTAGSILDGAAVLLLDLGNGTYSAATSSGAGTLAINPGTTSGTVDTDLDNGAHSVTHLTGTWNCGTLTTS
jgi:hypothetical protein